MAKKVKNPLVSKIIYCSFCGKEILPAEGEPIYIQTKRKTELYLHPGCIRTGRVKDE